MTEKNPGAKPKKKTVRVATERTAEATKSTGKKPSNWKPSAEAKAKATKFRIIAVVLWVLAIAAEIYAIFWVLKQDPVNMALLIGLIVGIGVLALIGGQLWKKANGYDPASEKDKFRFFVQNQLGAIITIVAFLPLIILVFLNKDMDGKQKGIAGGIAIALLAVVGLLNADFDPPSVEKYDYEERLVKELTGEDLVYWVKSGSVYHLCDSVSAVTRESADGQIYEGTVQDAHDAGKHRLTKQVRQELNQCRIPIPDNLDDLLAGKFSDGQILPEDEVEYDDAEEADDLEPVDA